MKTLNIERTKSFVGAAMPYRIYVNGTEQGKLMIGNRLSVEIPDSNTVLKVSMGGNISTFHKMEKEIVIFPEHCRGGIINCTISTKLNWIGLLTMGIFQAVGRLDINVKYQL